MHRQLHGCLEHLVVASVAWGLGCRVFRVIWIPIGIIMVMISLVITAIIRRTIIPGFYVKPGKIIP